MPAGRAPPVSVRSGRWSLPRPSLPAHDWLAFLVRRLVSHLSPDEDTRHLDRARRAKHVD